MASQQQEFPIPYGWFHVGFECDLKPGEVKSLHYFGRDLVLWRSESGEFCLQDAYCPHLGAHLGVGGEVVGDSIRCPFHHWQFDTTGRLTTIPYAKRLNKQACLYRYPLQVRYGVVMAWYHPDNVPPLYDLPDIPEFEDEAFVGPISTGHEINTCLQEMAENTVDGAHFATVHGHHGQAEYNSVIFDGPKMHMDSKQTFPSSGGPVEGRLESCSTGFGWAVVRYKTLVDVVMLTTNVPVDSNKVMQYFHVCYRNPGRDSKIDRIGQAFNKEVNRQLTDDIVIWETKKYLPTPQLCDGDGPIARYRRWAQQFYVAGSA